MAVSVASVAKAAQPVRRALAGDFIRDGVIVFAATMAVNVLNYAFSFLLSRKLGVEGFAALSSLISFIMLASIPSSVLTLIVVRYAAAFHAVGDAERVRRLSVTLLKWTSAFAMLMSIAGVVMREPLASFLHITQTPTIVLAALIASLSIVTPSVRGILQGEADFGRYAASAVIEVLLKLLVALALAYLGFGLAGAMLGWLCGTACALAYTICAVLRKHGATGGPGVTLALDPRRVIATTSGVATAGAFLIMLGFTDVLLVKHYFSSYNAGLYAAANMTGKVVLFVAAFVPAVLLPKAVALRERGENAISLLVQALVVTALLSGGVLSVFSLDSAQIVRMFAGAAFVGAAQYVPQYDAAMCLLAVVTLLVNYRIGIHDFRFLYGLAAVCAFEITAIVLRHTSLMAVIHVLLIGNACAIVLCLFGIERRRGGSAHGNAAIT